MANGHYTGRCESTYLERNGMDTADPLFHMHGFAHALEDALKQAHKDHPTKRIEVHFRATLNKAKPNPTQIQLYEAGVTVTQEG